MQIDLPDPEPQITQVQERAGGLFPSTFLPGKSTKGNLYQISSKRGKTGPPSDSFFNTSSAIQMLPSSLSPSSLEDITQIYQC